MQSSLWMCFIFALQPLRPVPQWLEHTPYWLDWCAQHSHSPSWCRCSLDSMSRSPHHPGCPQMKQNKNSKPHNSELWNETVPRFIFITWNLSCTYSVSELSFSVSGFVYYTLLRSSFMHQRALCDRIQRVAADLEICVSTLALFHRGGWADRSDPKTCSTIAKSCTVSSEHSLTFYSRSSHSRISRLARPRRPDMRQLAGQVQEAAGGGAACPLVTRLAVWSLASPCLCAKGRRIKGQLHCVFAAAPGMHEAAYCNWLHLWGRPSIYDDRLLLKNSIRIFADSSFHPAL